MTRSDGDRLRGSTFPAEVTSVFTSRGIPWPSTPATELATRARLTSARCELEAQSLGERTATERQGLLEKLEKLEKPPGSYHRSSQSSGSPPQFSVGGHQGDLVSLVRDGADEHVVPATRSVEDGHSVGHSCGDASTGLSFENDDDRCDNSTRCDGGLHLFHEEPGRCRLGPATSQLARPDDIRGIDKEHSTKSVPGRQAGIRPGSRRLWPALSSDRLVDWHGPDVKSSGTNGQRIFVARVRSGFSRIPLRGVGLVFDDFDVSGGHSSRHVPFRRPRPVFRAGACPGDAGLARPAAQEDGPYPWAEPRAWILDEHGGSLWRATLPSEAGEGSGGKESVAVIKPEFDFGGPVTTNRPVQDSQQEVTDVGASSSLIKGVNGQLEKLLAHTLLAIRLAS